PELAAQQLGAVEGGGDVGEVHPVTLGDGGDERLPGRQTRRQAHPGTGEQRQLAPAGALGEGAGRSRDVVGDVRVEAAGEAGALEGRVVGAGRGHDDDVQVVPGDDALTGGELLVDDGAGDVAEAATPGAERGQRDEHLGTTGARLQPGGGDLLQGSPEPVHHRGELAADLTAAADDVDEPGGLHQLGGPAAAEAALRPVRR